VTKSRSLRVDFERAVARLDEALALPKDPIVRDAAIQRFEISFELCWKFLKAYLEEEHNASCTSLAARRGCPPLCTVLAASDSR
jgi:hypothetical protein